MKLAISEAKLAGKKDEVPIGAVLVDKRSKIIASGHNQTITLNDPTAHAEILTLRKAGLKILNYRLLNTTLYVLCVWEQSYMPEYQKLFSEPAILNGGAPVLYMILQKMPD